MSSFSQHLNNFPILKYPRSKSCQPEYINDYYEQNSLNIEDQIIKFENFLSSIEGYIENSKKHAVLDNCLTITNILLGDRKRSDRINFGRNININQLTNNEYDKGLDSKTSLDSNNPKK